jgi:hypothetical protein
VSGLNVHNPVLNSAVLDQFNNAVCDIDKLHALGRLQVDDSVLNPECLARSFQREESFNHSVLPLFD